jgi:hypothetical protein
MSYARSVIKSIQTGDTTIAHGSSSTTATITSVDTSKTFVNLRMVGATAGDPPFFLGLANATTLTLYKSATTTAITMRWQIMEFY